MPWNHAFTVKTHAGPSEPIRGIASLLIASYALVVLPEPMQHHYSGILSQEEAVTLPLADTLPG